MLLAIVTVALLAALAAVLLRRGSLGPLAVVFAAGVWLALNEPIEGPILVRITSRHGVHLADVALVVVVSLALGIRLNKTLAEQQR